MDVISTGMTALKREKVEVLKGSIVKILKDNDETARKTGLKYIMLFEETKKTIDTSTYGQDALTEAEFNKVLKILENEELIGIFGSKKTQVVKLQEPR